MMNTLIAFNDSDTTLADNEQPFSEFLLDLPLFWLLLGIIIAALSLSTAIFSQKLVDTLLPAGDTVRLVVGLSLLVLLLVARSGLQFLRGHCIVLHSKAFNNRLISQFYATMLRLPQRFFDHRKTGDLIARMNDAQRLQQAVSYLAGEVMIDVILFCIAALVLALYAPPIAAFVVAASAVYAWWMARMHTPIVQAQKAVMSSYAVNESHYVDTIQGIATIKATGTEAVFSQLARTVFGGIWLA